MSNKDVSKKLSELAARANAIKRDTQLRHVPSKHDIQTASANAYFMQPYQYQTLKSESVEN